MKRFLLSLLAAATFTASAYGTQLSVDQLIADEVATTSKEYSYDFSLNRVDLLSAQIDLSSAVVPAVTFNDGRVSTGSITVTSTASMVGAGATNTLTVSSNTALVGASGYNFITITSHTALSGHTLTIAGHVLTGGVDFGVSISSHQTALNLAAQIQGTGLFLTSVNSGSLITVTCSVPGTACNSYAVTSSSPAAMSVAYATMRYGQNNPSFTINNQLYTQGIDWTTDLSYSSNTAVSIKNAINSLDTQGVTASTTSSNVVTITVTSAGTAGNSFTLASSTQAALAAGASTFSGGLSHPTITVHTTTLTEGTHWTVSTATGTAISIKNAINSALSSIVTASTTVFTSSGVVNIVSVGVGTSANYRLARFAPAGIVLSGPNMTGGLDSAIDLTANELHVPSHGITTGMAVRFASATVTIGGLTNQATYYAIAVDEDNLQLSLTSTGSIAGLAIDLTSSSTAGPHTFTLTPLPLTGSPSMKWQVSQDGDSWSDMNVSSVTFTSPYATSSTLYDFGQFNFKFIRLPVTAPTQGGFLIKVRLYGRRYGRP